MNELIEGSTLLWQLMRENAKHIGTLNREFGVIAEAVTWIKIFIGFQFTFIVGTFVAVLRNLHWTKRNGLNKVNGTKSLAK